MQQVDWLEVVASKTVDGIEMGVFQDGSAFLTGRSLARLCGVAFSTIIERREEWDGGNRTGRFARFLTGLGFTEPRLAIPIKHTGVGVGAEAHAYPEVVVMAFLEYYALELARPDALANWRILGRAGLRKFVHVAIGYDPARALPDKWREFHDRLEIHTLPRGYFSVFREMADFIILAIQSGFRMDYKSLPDISVGRTWGDHWAASDLASVHGDRVKHDHNYPEYFPQAASNPQDIWVYPVSALGEFRTWLQNEWIPNRMPQYIAAKVKQGVLPASTAQLLLTAVEPRPGLPAQPRVPA